MADFRIDNRANGVRKVGDFFRPLPLPKRVELERFL